MTEKRFTKVENIFDMGDEGVKDNQTKIEYYYALDMIDVLNEQHEEIQQLKEEKETYKTLWGEMAYYFRDDVTLKDLDHKDFRSLQRLAKGLVD